MAKGSKDFEKDFADYEKKSKLRDFVKQHYDFIKGKVNNGKTLNDIFGVAQAMGFLRSFELSEFKVAYNNHKAIVEKTPENVADELLSNRVISFALNYTMEKFDSAAADDLKNNIKECKPISAKSLRNNWLPHFEKILEKGVMGINEKGDKEINGNFINLVYVALVAFFTKKRPAPDVLAQFDGDFKDLKKLIMARCPTENKKKRAAKTSPAAKSGGATDLLNQNKA